LDLKATILQEKIPVPDDFFFKVQKYKEQLFKWNKIHNLTGAKDEDTLNSFVYDALYPVSFLKPYKNLLDIGTGAGFPGMILAFALPDTEVTLVEPLTKRASFLQFIKADLGLKNVTVVKKRVEEMESKHFELITSRAVTDTKMLLDLSKNFRDASSTLLFYKGEKVFDEVDTTMKHKIIQTTHIDGTKRHYLLLGEDL
jgi:16S rRNA (guanine527-N7)-methyltransferase